MNHFKTWWEHTTGPMRFFDSIMRNVNNNTLCTVLSVPDKLPWHDGVCDLFHDRLAFSAKTLDVIDYAGVKGGIGDFLFEKYASRTQKSEYNLYLEDKKPAVDTFLAQEGVLHNKVIWIKNISDVNELRKHLLRKYSKKTPNNIVTFILEAADGKVEGDGKTEALRYSDYVSEYDIHLFASLVAAEKSEVDPNLRCYITFVAENLCGGDVESLVPFINDNDFREIDIVETFIRQYNSAKSNRSAIERRLWRAQIQAAFPLIEEERVAFIDNHIDDIAKWLPEEHHGQTVANPYHAELGHIVRMFGEKKLIVSPREYSRIHLLRDLRNNLAHMNCCSAGEICELLSGG